MTVAVRRAEKVSESDSSKRLKELQSLAARIREQHRSGEITAAEAARRLTELRRRHANILDVLVGA